jgi:hypothetical protein
MPRNKPYTSILSEEFELFLEMLDESLEYGHEFKGGAGRTDDELLYTFKNDGGDTIKVRLLSHDSDDIWDTEQYQDIEVEFFKDGSKGGYGAGDYSAILNSGDALKVVRTVYDIVKDYMMKWEEKNGFPFGGTVRFSGAGDEDGKGGSGMNRRTRVYLKAIKKLFKTDPYTKKLNPKIDIDKVDEDDYMVNVMFPDREDG